MKLDNKNKFNPIQSWIDNVAYEHSNSIYTARNYRRHLDLFLKFTGKTSEQILAEYESSSDREFRRKYARYIRAWIANLSKTFTKNTIRVMVTSIKSFFKYSDLPLGYVPMAKASVSHHNRDITKEEIAEVLRIARPRDRAFFAVMAQSGLRPHTLCQLRIKHLQPDFSKERIPCKIEVPEELAKGKYKPHFTFIAEEALTHLRDYLKTRPNITRESYLFTQYGKKTPITYSNASHRFRLALLKLKEKGIVDFEQKEAGKPSQLRLYNLRKWFRKQAHQAGFELVQFWMGHTVVAGVDEHYRPRDPEFHRKLYAEKAMPFLRIEQATPTQTEEVIAKQAERIEELERKLAENIEMKQTLTGLEAKYVELLKRLERMEKQQS